MNTSSDGTSLGVHPFQYPQVGTAPGALESCDSSGPEDRADRERQAHSDGFREGLERARREYEESLKRGRTLIEKTTEDFRRDREDYFERIEAEVVRLALSIARKILHRESQVDPLLLSGMVRVALRKLAAGIDVRLVVTAGETAVWRKDLNDVFESGAIKGIEEDQTLTSGTCILRTEMGTTELGIEPQLKEIENGLLDLLASRPRV